MADVNKAQACMPRPVGIGCPSLMKAQIKDLTYMHGQMDLSNKALQLKNMPAKYLLFLTEMKYI